MARESQDTVDIDILLSTEGLSDRAAPAPRAHALAGALRTRLTTVARGALGASSRPLLPLAGLAAGLALLTIDGMAELSAHVSMATLTTLAVASAIVVISTPPLRRRARQIHGLCLLASLPCAIAGSEAMLFGVFVALGAVPASLASTQDTLDRRA